MHLLDAVTISAISGLIVSITVLVVVIAALRMKEPDDRAHVLRILNTLLRWRDRPPSD
jgi:hypothetical protein